MSNIALDVEIINEQKLREIFRMAPLAFTKAMGTILIREKNLFVGTKKSDGSFGRELGKKVRKYKPGTWRKYVARAFTGYLHGENSISTMRINMGVKDDRLKKIPYIEALGMGATITPKNAEWLMIPHYKNLLSVGLFGRYGGSGKLKFSDLLKGRLDYEFVNKGGKLLVMGDFAKEGGSHEKRHISGLHNKLLFTGVKKSRVPKQFDFKAAWAKRMVGFSARGEKYLEKQIKALELGKFGAW